MKKDYILVKCVFDIMFVSVGVGMGDIFDYSPIDMSSEDFWTLIGAVAFVFGIKLAADDRPEFPSYYGLVLSLSSGLFMAWIRFYR